MCVHVRGVFARAWGGVDSYTEGHDPLQHPPSLYIFKGDLKPESKKLEEKIFR